MTWKGLNASVSLLDKVYEKGVSLTKEEMQKYQAQIRRSDKLPKWEVKILPQSG